MRKTDYVYLILLLFINIIFASFTDVYLTAEHYGYWYFNKIFLNNYTFPDLSRSPFYIIYLSLFNWLTFPYNMLIEAITANFIACSSLYFLFKDKFKKIFIFFYCSLGSRWGLCMCFFSLVFCFFPFFHFAMMKLACVSDISTHTRTHTHTHTHAHTHTHIHTHTCTYVHPHTHTHTYTYT